MSPILKAELNNIMDCFTGADGGVTFFKVKCGLEDLEKQGKKGDIEAREILKTVTRFSQLINVLSK